MAPLLDNFPRDNDGLAVIPLSEVKKRDCQNREEKWVIIHNNVYNVTDFIRKHPGGSKILNGYAGLDATVSCFSRL